jgi:ubiquitin-protein ligase
MTEEPRDIRITRSLVIGANPRGGRLAEERRILALHFPGFALDTSPDDAWAIVTGTLNTFTGRGYDIWITLPERYPHSLPVVYANGWKPIRNPHMYTDGTLCVMRPGQWSSFFSAASVVAKAAIWLNKYEIWIDRKIWPGPEQHEHGPFYVLRKKWNDL